MSKDAPRQPPPSVPLQPPPSVPITAPGERGVYCNRTLNLRSIKVIGYDMDYTLIHYRVEHWEQRAYEHIQKRLVASGVNAGDLKFDPELVVQGLIIDTETGNLLKANRFGFVKRGVHGTRAMSVKDIREAYATTVVDLRDSRFRFVNTLFALSEGCIFAQLVDRFDEGGVPDDIHSYGDLYRRVRSNVDATHTEGQLKAEIIANPARFIEPDEELVLTLLDQKNAGKRLALITNSEWSYTSPMMDHVFGPALGGPGKWKELFELSIVAARKPTFFQPGATILEVVNQEGLLKPVVGPLKKHAVYFGGNYSHIESFFDASEDEILYLGDHMYGDVHVTKNVLKWRTALILRELETEVASVLVTREQQSKLAALMRQKQQLERRQCQFRVALQRAKSGYGPTPDLDPNAAHETLTEIREALMALDELIGPIAREAASIPNPNWGLLLRAGNDKSLLARKIERYADVYTSRVSNFLYATPYAYLRSPRGSLPHDSVPSRSVLDPV